MPHSREIRYDLALVGPIMTLILFLPFAAIFWFILFITPLQLQSIFFLLLALLPSISALNALVNLLLWRIFRRSVLELTADGVAYASPSIPWRQIVVPWNDVARLSVVKRVYARSSANFFLVHTRHPERYRSLRARRFRAWWNPALDDATIAVSLSLLAGGTSLAKRQKFMERIETTFAREIGLYGVEVRSLARKA